LGGVIAPLDAFETPPSLSAAARNRRLSGWVVVPIPAQGEATIRSSWRAVSLTTAWPAILVGLLSAGRS